MILVRHGRTAANAAGLLQGRLDPDLDDVGRDQARCVGGALSGADRVVSSPLRRALQTAEAFGAPVEVDPRWIELDYGVYEGRPQADLGAAQWARWRADPRFAPEGGESLSALADRVRPALDELAESAREATVVVVTHVSPIKAAVAWAMGVGIEVSWRTQLDQASITRVVMGPRGPVLKTFNETWHLGDAGPAWSP